MEVQLWSLQVFKQQALHANQNDKDSFYPFIWSWPQSAHSLHFLFQANSADILSIGSHV